MAEFTPSLDRSGPVLDIDDSFFVADPAYCPTKIRTLCNYQNFVSTPAIALVKAKQQTI